MYFYFPKNKVANNQKEWIAGRGKEVMMHDGRQPESPKALREVGGTTRVQRHRSLNDFVVIWCFGRAEPASVTYSETRNVLGMSSVGSVGPKTNTTSFITVSLSLSTSLSALIGLGYGLHPAEEMDSHRKTSEMSEKIAAEREAL